MSFFGINKNPSLSGWIFEEIYLLRFVAFFFRAGAFFFAAFFFFAAIFFWFCNRCYKIWKLLLKVLTIIRVRRRHSSNTIIRPKLIIVHESCEYNIFFAKCVDNFSKKYFQKSFCTLNLHERKNYLWKIYKKVFNKKKKRRSVSFIPSSCGERG